MSKKISIHAPRAGRDSQFAEGGHQVKDFNPRAPCGARREFCLQGLQLIPISIHAPRAGRDETGEAIPALTLQFQSTRPVRGATASALEPLPRDAISIHAPRAGRDFTTEAQAEAYIKFQSTRPVRGATGGLQAGNIQQKISIHAPRAGRDTDKPETFKGNIYFNPRAPCGARPYDNVGGYIEPLFQSTRPVRGATALSSLIHESDRISIHAPRAGRDTVWTSSWVAPTHFNPRAPCGARPMVKDDRLPLEAFQSTRPVRGATQVPAC